MRMRVKTGKDGLAVKECDGSRFKINATGTLGCSVHAVCHLGAVRNREVLCETERMG